MKYKILSPEIPEIVKVLMEKDLVKGFYTPYALPLFKEVQIEFYELPPDTELTVNGQKYKTDSEGKFIFTYYPTKSEDYTIEIEYSETKTGTTLLFREYVNLSWILADLFRFSYWALFVSRLLMLSDDVDTTSIRYFQKDDTISNAGEDLESLFGDNSMWTGALGGLFDPTAYPGLGQIREKAFKPAREVLSASSDISMFYYMEKLLNTIYPVGEGGFVVSFLPMSRNIFRYGFLNNLIEYMNLEGDPPTIRWVNFSLFLQEILFNSLSISPNALPNEHELPDIPTAEGVYVLVYSPNLEEWDFVSKENYSFVHLTGGITEEIKIGYHIEEIAVKARWDAERKVFLTPTPLLNYKKEHTIIYNEGTTVFPFPIQKTSNTFMVSNDNNYGISELKISSIGLKPYIPLFVFRVDSGGNLQKWTDVNNYLISEVESLSGVDVFIHLNVDNPDSDTYRDTIKTSWLILEKTTIPSLMVIGWAGIFNDYLDEGSPTFIPGFKSIHKRI